MVRSIQKWNRARSSKYILRYILTLSDIVCPGAASLNGSATNKISTQKEKKYVDIEVSLYLFSI